MSVASPENVIKLPYYLGELSTNSVPEFLNDLFLSSSGTIVLSVFMLTLLFLWRCFVDDSEEQEQFVENLKEEELKQKWERHNEKWGTTYVPPAKETISMVPLPQSETKTINTVPLPTTVTILGNIKEASAVFITYHDIGMNHRWCFNRLINLMNGNGMLDNIAVVHIDAPGHEDGCSPIDINPASISLEMLAQQLNNITVEIGVDKFVGLGIGAGANILLRHASIHPAKVTGLILANASVSEASLIEKLSLATVTSMMWPFKLRSYAVSQMANIHFSRRALACKSLPRAFAKSYRKPAEWDNKMWFIRAFIGRDKVDASRLGSLSDVPMLCFSAHESAGVGVLSNSYFEEDTDAMVTELIVEGFHQRVKHMRIRGCGSQLFEERSEELLQPIKLFAAGLGVALGK